MQTASKVEIDNWNDLNGQMVMNIRPTGTYPKPHCHCHHNYHKQECLPVKPHECPCEHTHHIPVDIQPIIPHLHPVDLDGDGFVENDIIIKHSDCACDTVDTNDNVYGAALHKQEEIDEVLTEVWTTPEVVTAVSDEINTNQPEPVVEVQQIEEQIEQTKPVRTRKVNRGGRRKKED